MNEKPVNKKPKKKASKSVSLDPLIAERRRIPRPLPLPEVIEGSGDESEWAMWLEQVEQVEQQALTVINLDSPE